MQSKIAKSSTGITVVILLLVSIVPLVTAYRYPAYLNDDAYITLAFAKNLASENGFVFNHSPALLGTTSPLLTFIVAWLSWILPAIDIPTLAVFLTALCWLGILWTFFHTPPLT